MRGTLASMIPFILLCGCTLLGDDYQETSIENVTSNMSGFFGKDIKVEGFLMVSHTSKGNDLVFLKDPQGNVLNLILPGKRDETKGWDMGKKYLVSGEYYQMGGRYTVVEKGAYATYSLNVSKVE
jgi:hypothetical protein